MLKEFKEFAMRGSVLDLAVGIIIGGVFGKIVTSFVNDILMPPIGLLLGRVNFNNLFISLNGQTYQSLDVAKAAGAPTINYGLFLQSLVDFVIIAFVIFLLIKQINRLREQEPPAPTTRECPFCTSLISKKAKRCAFCTSEVPVAA